MSQKVIVRLTGVGARRTLHVALDRSPFVVEGDDPDRPLGCGPSVLKRFSQEAPTSDVVQLVGSKLFTSLVGHPKVSKAFQSALAQQGGCPIYLRLEAHKAAEFPWESLFDSDGQRFLALHRDWPIGRILPTNDQASRHYIAPPVRVVAVLSATGVDAAGEWRGLAQAVEATDVDVRVNVVVGQRDLFKAISAERPPWADVTLLTDGDAIARTLKKFDPHFVHFFCHGTARPTPTLELATSQAHAGRFSDVVLSPAWFKKKADMPLLATLNCCRGASDIDGVRGLASELVVNADYPAAIGMREPIAATDAHVFAKTFYEEVFGMLEEAFADGQAREMEWAGALCAARQALRQEQAGGLAPAGRNRKWTVPILYTGLGTLTIDPVAVHPSHSELEKIARLKQMNTLARGLGQLTSDPVALGAVLQRIEQIRAELGDEA
jgi:hypothetical protein